jgi:DNA-nicking Smr family endonuclease
MAARRLSPDERAAWALLARTVRRLHAEAPAPHAAPDVPPVPAPPPAPVRAPRKTPAAAPPSPPPPPPARRPVDTLDSSWEKRLRRGALVPDIAIDLHGHSLSAAHARLDQVLAEARATGIRVVLVVTGKPRASGASGERAGRGAIRAEIGHWLETGRHADAIASVRRAHPRHGGDGALYVILRRKK